MLGGSESDSTAAGTDESVPGSDAVRTKIARLGCCWTPDVDSEMGERSSKERG